jgi:hypothetical protein
VKLTSCNPINYANYIALQPIQDFIHFTTNYIHNNELNGNTGWTNQLMSYSYDADNADFVRGIEIRLEFHRMLREALSQTNEQVLVVVNDIMKWGGLKSYQINFIPQIQQALHFLDEIENGNSDNWGNNLIGKRITSISKIFEMYRPKLWAIYDSRVGKGIQLLLSLHQPHCTMLSDYLRFQCPHGRNRFPIDGFRLANSPKQAILGFLYASWLFRSIAIRLNDLGIMLPEEAVNLQQDRNWYAYHIEMIFFMIGK